MATSTITIKGTHCMSCKALIEDACRDVPGVSACTVDFITGKTVIEHEENMDWQQLKKEIELLGSYTLERA